MITTILKQKYHDLLKTQPQVDPAEFIALASIDHNTDPEVIGLILKDCEWFKIDES